MRENDVKPGFNSEAVLLQLADYRDMAEWLPWAGRTGSSDRAVLLALVEIGFRHTTTAPLASIRDIHLATGKAKSTISKALRRLEGDKWIDVKRGGSSGDDALD